MKVRLQKFLSEAGLGSRRGCEELIAEGRVSVNGEQVRVQGVRVDAERDVVDVDGKRVRQSRKLSFAVYKPAGYSCSGKRGGDPDVRVLIGKRRGRFLAVPALGVDSEGLVIVTNDGELAHVVDYPRHEVPRVFMVHVKGTLDADALKFLQYGLRARGGGSYGLRIVSKGRGRHEITMPRGRDRDLREALAAVQCSVGRLRLVRVGPVELGSLKPGRSRPLRRGEIRALMGGAEGRGKVK